MDQLQLPSHAPMVALCKAFNAFDPLTKDASASRNLAHQQVVQALRQRKKFLSQGWTYRQRRNDLLSAILREEGR